MSLPTISGTARATADPELKFSASGVAVCRINLAFNSRKRQDDGTWVDDQTCFLSAVAFKQLAEHVAESISRATEVVVTGRLVTKQWTDKENNKRTSYELLLDSIGPSLTFASAQVQKMQRSSGASGSRQAKPDPWATAAPASGFDDSAPPF